MSFAGLIEKANNMSLSKFGSPATFYLNGTAVKTVTAIFDQAVEVYSPGQTDMTEFKPAITVATSDMDGITRTHTVTTGGKEYKIFREPEPDGHGMTHLILAAKK